MTQARPANRDPGLPANHHADVPPHWEIRVSSSGLTAVLTGIFPPITVSAPDMDSLRKKIKIIVFQALL
jgi:hypothetical protein